MELKNQVARSAIVQPPMREAKFAIGQVVKPFYHLRAENAQTTYVAYVSEQNLLPDETGKPVSHPQVPHFFKELKRGHYVSRDRALH
jgi:heat shock protein HspQ